MKGDIESADTSGSSALMTLRKDVGKALDGSQGTLDETELFIKTVSRWNVGIGTCINTNMFHLRRLAGLGKPQPGGGWVGC